MAVITKITTQQTNKERYNIFMDYGKGEEFAFSVDEDVLIKYQLKKGLELDDFSLMEINYQDEIRKAYSSAITYLSKRLRSEKEIRTQLQKKDIQEPVINEVILKLKTQKYVDDQEYAHAYVRTQVNTTDKGPDVIKLELIEKGIDKPTIKSALDVYPFDLQVGRAIKISEKFYEKNERDSKRVLKQKLENLLLRKGYPFEVINIAGSEVNIDEQVDQELEAIRFQGEKAHRKFSSFSGYEYRQKMKQTLFRKGFSMDLIEKFLDEKQQEKS